MDSTATRPRMRLVANGVPVPVMTAEWTQTGYYRASHFTATVPLYTDATHAAAFWIDAASFDVELKGGFLPGGSPEGAVPWQSVFKGVSDERASVNLDTGIVTLTGRDFTGKLLDAKTAETFANQTLAQIATTLAGRVGLKANVSSGSQLAGQFYQLDHARTAHDTFSRSANYWEIITYLAQQEGYDVWVDGNTLHVAPKEAQDSTQPVFTITSTPMVFTNGVAAGRACNVENLTLIRNPALAKDIQVTVRSWGPKAKAAVFASDGPASAEQKITKTFPNKTMAECQALARTIRADLGRHEKIITFGMDGEFNMRPRQPIANQGTGTSYDTTFYLAEIEREYNLQDGFWQHVRARNVPPVADQATP